MPVYWESRSLATCFGERTEGTEKAAHGLVKGRRLLEIEQVRRAGDDDQLRAGDLSGRTLIEEETLVAVGEQLGIAIPLHASRRQIVVRGPALNPTVSHTLRVGDVLLAATSYPIGYVYPRLSYPTGFVALPR